MNKTDKIWFGSDPETGKEFTIPFADLRQRHLHVMGQSGSGKSYFLAHFALSLILNGFPVFLLDYKGDTYEILLKHLVDRHMRRRAVVVDPEDTTTYGVAPGLNCLDEEGPPDRVAEKARILLKFLFGQQREHNPWLDDTAGLSLNLLTHTRQNENPWTVFEAADVLKLADRAFSQRLSEMCEESAPFVAGRLKELWKHRMGDLAQIVNPLKNRLAQLRYSSALSSILGQPHTSINFDRLLARRGIFLMRAFHPDFSQSDLDFLAAIAFQKIKSAVFRRSERQRNKPAFLIIDEVQRLCSGGMGEELADLLERARSYGLQVVCAHQFLTQLLPQDNPRDTRLLDSILSQTALKVYFKIGRRDVDDLKVWADMFGDRMEETIHEHKHTVETIAFRPVKRYETIISENYNKSRSKNDSDSEGESEEISKSKSQGRSKLCGRNKNWTNTDSVSHSHAKINLHTDSEGEAEGETSTLNATIGASTGQVVDSDGKITDTVNDSVSTGEGTGHSRVKIRVQSDTSGDVDTLSNGHSKSKGGGTNETEGSNSQDTHGRSRGKNRAHQKGSSFTEGYSISISEHPFHDFEEFIQKGAVTFITCEEARERFMNFLMQLPKRTFWLKLDIQRAIKLFSPELYVPHVYKNQIKRFKMKIFPGYTKDVVHALDELNTRVPLFLKQHPKAIAPPSKTTEALIEIAGGNKIPVKKVVLPDDDGTQNVPPSVFIQHSYRFKRRA